MPSIQARRASTGTTRPFALLLIMVLCAGLISARLAFWTVLEHGHLSAAAAAQREALTVQPPLRGHIFDSQGNPLATEMRLNAVYAVPKQIKQPGRTAALLAPVLGKAQQNLYQMLTDYTGFVRIAWGLSPATSQKIQALALPGTVLIPEVQRYYPARSVASQAIGYVNQDGTGSNGLEGYYNTILSGTSGLRTVLKDTAGNSVHVTSSASSPSRAGADLHLTLDPTVQQVAEDELAKAVKKHRADGGTVIISDPRTGYILAMTSDPSYNPNRYSVYANHGQADLFRNPAIQWNYEPGSTFKIVTMAAGLDSSVITPQSALYDTGQFHIADVTLHNWNLQGFGYENMTQVLQHSANVGASWVAGRLGQQRFYSYVNRFRFGQPTGVDLQGEEIGQVPHPGDKIWTIVNLYTNSFGQGLTVTPLQMIRAVNAVANGGVLMKPQLVKRIDYGGNTIDLPPVSQGRAISATTAHTLTDMLVHSAIGGEAQLGLVHGYNIAAKTGTANIAGPDGRYIQGTTIASIVGFAPAYHPRFSVLVILRHPRDIPWGSMTAGPVLKNLFQELFMRYRVPPASHPAY